MVSLNNTNVQVFVLVLNVLLQSVESTQSLVTNDIRGNLTCPLPLTTLDFIYNFTQPNLEIVWPCEVRAHWLTLQPFVKFVRFLLSYITPFIIILGVLLNTVSFGMLSTPILCESNLSRYLKALALSDNGALIFNYGVGIAKSHFTFVNNLFMNSRFLCSLNSVTMEFFQFTSTWLVVALTWTRLFAIMFPFGIRGHCYNCSEIITLTILICTTFIISLTKLYSGGYETDSVFEFIPCQKMIIPWGSPMYFYIALSTWLPLLFIFIGNILLIIHMKKTEKIRSQLTQNFRHKANRTHHTSRILFVVSTVYLVLILPLGIVETLELYWDVILIKYPATEGKEKMEYVHWLKEKMLLKWCRGLCFHVYHWNFAINFFLYCLTGKKFRNVVIQTMKRYKNIIFSVFFKHIDKCISCSNYSTHLKTVQSSNVLLIRAITLSEHSISGSVLQSNSNIIANN
ncbi:probable G-protein coupled receptor 139 [Hylaeus anthracinus]|uniref:probable G-protein coupled receptor 139 n=1 Tax=Hylaeus anthracinus TaxID=313031 RepID=UPI0023B9225D|nr:probable G-protein coupled receptor 139 [Hylaeus anthracinus]